MQATQAVSGTPQAERTPMNPSARRLRRFRSGPRGVSEIIGTILIVSLTVVLFATIFYFVSTLPGPTSQSNSQFSAALGVSAGGTEAYINITYTVGPTLVSTNTPIYLSSSEHAVDYSCTRTGNYGDPYSPQQGLAAYGSPTTWSAGETWSLHLVTTGAAETVCPGGSLVSSNDNISISIASVAQNLLLFHVTLPGTAASIPPTFYNYALDQNGTGGVTDPYSIVTDIKATGLNPNSVYVTFPTGAGFPATAQELFYNGVTGQWNRFFAEDGAQAGGVAYTFIINATTYSSQRNSVVFTYTFPTQPNTAALTVTLSLTNGIPEVNQADTLTASVVDSGGTAVNGICVNFTWSKNGGGTGTIGATTCIGYLPANGAGTGTAQVSWKAGPQGDGDYVLTAKAGDSVTSSAAAEPITVFPRTLLIDETGVAAGSNVTTDTFTYLETALNSADVPYNTTVVPPGSSVIGWGCAAPTCLNNYDVIIWLLSNTGKMSASDVQALNYATGGTNPVGPGDRSVWLLGANALSGNSGLYGNFGINTVATDVLASASPTSSVALTATGPTIPTSGIFAGTPSNLYIDPCLGGTSSWNCPFTSYGAISPGGATPATAFLKTGAADVATAYNGTWKALAMPFELSALGQTMPWGSTTYTTALGQQAAIAYDAFNWLANFTMPGVNGVREGNDWAVSEVDVEPATLSFNSPAWVNVTVRDNGPTSALTTAELLVDNLPLYVDGSAVTATADPTGFGGITRFSFNWTPSYIGYLTIGVEIFPPSSDLDSANNIMENSLFSTQLYVHYNVLLVDATLKGVAGASCEAGTCHDTTTQVYDSLIADGYPASTITETTITSDCGSLPATPLAQLESSPPHYNLVVWNLDDVVNGTACPLSAVNAGALESFLNNGGGSSALLFLGNGLLTDSGGHASAATTAFMQSYLGIPEADINQPTLTQKTVYGAVNNPVGDGVSFGYDAGLNYTGSNAMYAFTSLNGTSNLWKSVALYYNDVDYWTLPTTWEGAGIAAYSTAASWHTSFLGIDPDLMSSGTSGQLDLAMLRFSTFVGRLLPEANPIVSAPDITFALTSAPYTNFDQMHPQLEQQYLIDANVTNLGGSASIGVSLEVYDGTTVLGSDSVSVAASSESSSGANVTFGQGTLSVPWTPLYGYTNPIEVVITTTASAQILPAVDQFAEWNVTVYLFYDATNNNVNQWSHQELTDWAQDGSGSPPVGQQIYYSDDSNVPSGPLTDDAGAGTSGSGGSFQCNLYGPDDCNVAFNGTPAAADEGEWWHIGCTPGCSATVKVYECTISEDIYGGTCNYNTNSFYYAECINEYDGVGGAGMNYETTDQLTDGDYIYLPTTAEGAPGPTCTAPGGTGTGATAWTQASGVCYEYLWECVSNYYADSQTNAGTTKSVDWIYSDAMDLASVGGTLPASAEADWWQAYAISPYQNGGIVCVTTVVGDCPTGHGGSIVTDEACTDPCTAVAGDTAIVTPGPGYSGTVAWEDSADKCEVIQAFTGANTGFTGDDPNSWQYESVNLSAWIGQSTVYVAFGYVQGTSAAPCEGSGSPEEVGWYIDQFEEHVTGGTTQACGEEWDGGGSAACWTTTGTADACGSQAYQDIPFSDTWRLATAATLATYTGMNATALDPPTGSLWLNGAVSGTQLSLNPNEWDELYSRSIDLTNAANATLTFNYVWDRYALNMDPPLGLALDVSPVLSNGETDWVQVWSANLESNGNPSPGNDQNWQFASVNLQGYVGSVIKLEFIVGSNCGGDGDEQGGDAYDFNYPTAQVTYAGISGIYIQGSTVLTAVPAGPAVLAAEAYLEGSDGVHSMGHAGVAVPTPAEASTTSVVHSAPPLATNPMAARAPRSDDAHEA